ncbi:hypothetical protein AURDEDRAFT_187305 [Auricularia subglabra TFB-10046 SS5]|uniref:Uncharacterized protein n=1 Tax=Auricularia subglabra (strain TFB-10046 / SS5) TaxID=717982 RepID=J0DC24_AURST|nr:hypothetical protein AURDEDRAFT_187305 [Auricularia subglabra TFB-10046 SS5]
MARTKSVSGRSRTTSAARAAPVSNGAANTKMKNSKGKNGGRQTSQPLKQPSERRKRLSKKAAATAAVTTRASPADSTSVAPCSPATAAREMTPAPAGTSPTPSASSSLGPTRVLRPRIARAQPYSKEPATRSRRQSARAATPAPFAQDEDIDNTSDDDSAGPVTPTTTPTRPAVRGLDGVSPLLARRTPIGKSPLRKCLMTAEDLEALQSTGPAVDCAPPSNFGTLLVAPVLLSVTWGISFSTVDDSVLAAATTLAHLREELCA